ncbi:hypothetical protein ACX801_09030 [Arthrobacter bambusae]
MKRNLPLREIKLPRMTVNALLRSGVQTVGQLIALSAKNLREDVAGIGAGSILAIEGALADEGLRLAPDNGSDRYIRPSDRHVRNHKAWLQPVVELPVPARNE